MKLPIGMQTFREIREKDLYYVDKTRFAHSLIESGKHFFLSRPRRFGKSLFLDMLKELYEGSDELFDGLFIHERWDWSVSYPVVRLDFSAGDYTIAKNLQDYVMAELNSNEKRLSVRCSEESAILRFRLLLEGLHEEFKLPVVVLIDEYDKPIVDVLDDPEVASSNRNFLRSLYANLKRADSHIHFSFTTGVSKFSKVSLFSGVNNLFDITLVPSYSSICGYEETDLDQVFTHELSGLDRSEIRDWYNGYSWLGDTRVYNPFDILLLFATREFKAHWFETGTPAFLVKTLMNRQLPSFKLDGMLASEDLLASFDIEEITPEALLFQTGYLTIVNKEQQMGETYYRLGYPNREVRQGLNRSLARYLVGDSVRHSLNSNRLFDLMREDHVDDLQDLFHAFFASIPYEWYSNNDIDNYEGFYASVVYSYFAGRGMDVTVEDSVSSGRMDMSVRFEGRAYVFEFKVVEQADSGAAMAQLRDRGYADKFRAEYSPVYLIGVEFSSKERNIVAFNVETV